MAADTTDDFQKELVDLFVQEAHEWLQNIHVALDELQQGPAPERHAKLIGTISAGVMNLGGSAATINLPDVAHVSFETIPFIETSPAAVQGRFRKPFYSSSTIRTIQASPYPGK